MVAAEVTQAWDKEGWAEKAEEEDREERERGTGAWSSSRPVVAVAGDVVSHAYPFGREKHWIDRDGLRVLTGVRI
jgi:hypothetical protein